MRIHPLAPLWGVLAGCAPEGQDTALDGDPFADELVAFEPGEGAGYGQESLPSVVLGPPEGQGDQAGSEDVVSLGTGGQIVLCFSDGVAVDGDGPDLLVFENPFVGWLETGAVAASEDGVTWSEWPCDPSDVEGGYPGCAGTHPVYSRPDNGIDPTDPAAAGGDPFDLADLGLASASCVRIRDTGTNPTAEPTGGFDLDALAVVNGG